MEPILRARQGFEVAGRWGGEAQWARSHFVVANGFHCRAACFITFTKPQYCARSRGNRLQVHIHAQGSAENIMIT